MPGSIRYTAYILALALLLLPTNASAAGFAVADQGASASGMGNAATAHFDLAEAAYFNPSAYALRPGGQLTLGTALVLPSIAHTSPSTGVSTAAQTSTSTVPHLHGGYGFSSPNLAVVVYAGAPFGSGIAWDDNWTGRFEVTELSLRAFETGLNVAYGHNFGLFQVAVAAGPRYVLSDVELRRKVDAVDTEGDVRIVGDGSAVSGQASLSVATPFVRFGANYRPRVTLEYSGVADFSNIPIELAGRARDQDVTTSVTLPDRLAFGLATNLFGRLLLTFDAEVFLWSTFDSFGIDFSAEETPDVTQPRDWHNTIALRVGAEVDPGFYGVRVRTGFANDPTPSPTDTLSPTSPDSTRRVLTLGAGWRSPFGLELNAAWGHIFLSDTASTGDAFPGEYRGSADVINMSAGYRF